MVGLRAGSISRTFSIARPVPPLESTSCPISEDKPRLAFLPPLAASLRTPQSPIRNPQSAIEMVPGEIIPADAPALEANLNLATTTLEVTNTGDRPIQVGSHYHFLETNEALRFNRSAARGFRLLPRQKCGDHDVGAYLARVNAMKRQFARLAVIDSPSPVLKSR